MVKNNLIAFFTEGSSELGFGHITRCFSLAQALEERGFRSSFYVYGDEGVFSFLPKSDVKIGDWVEDVSVFRKEFRQCPAAIVDSYRADLKSYQHIANNTDMTLYIDDLMRLAYPDGIVVNGTIHSENMPYQKAEGTRYLLGSCYIPLRKPFWDMKLREVNAHIHDVLIMMGGSDVRNLTPFLIKTISKTLPEAKLHIIVGKGFINGMDIESEITENTVIYYNPDAETICKLMNTVDVAVSAAGQTLYELASCGVPTISIQVIENQKYNVEGWKETGFVTHAGNFDDPELFMNIERALHKLADVEERRRTSLLGRSFVDGNGSRRVAAGLLGGLEEREGFYMRRAGMEDCERVFELSNDSVVRANSINTDAIVWENHVAWFEGKLKDSQYDIFVCFDAIDRFIGQVKFEYEEDFAVISVSITEACRGKGYAVPVLKNACRYVFGEGRVERIHAYIRPENGASIRAFGKSGFGFLRDEEVKGEVFGLYVLGV